jgi:hypothetical protein
LLSMKEHFSLKEASVISLEAEMYQRKAPVARVEDYEFPFDAKEKRLEASPHTMRGKLNESGSQGAQ